MRLLLILSVAATAAVAQRSFAQTKFELSADLPFEEPTALAESHDAKPKTVKAPHRKHHQVKPVEPIPTPSPATAPRPLAQSPPPAPLPPQMVVPVRTLTPNAVTAAAPVASGLAGGQSAAPSAAVPPVAAATPPVGSLSPQIPQLVAGIPPAAPVAPLSPQIGPQTPPPSPLIPPPPQPFPPFGVQPPIAAPPLGTPFPAFPTFQPFGPTAPPPPQQPPPQPQFAQSADVQPIRATTSPQRVELWFSEDFDTTHCNQSARQLANDFRAKFPSNLWRNGKETILTELLAARLHDCFAKQSSNHWVRVNDLITGLRLPTTEEEECRSGLIQEQISCDNVFSFTCQFVQPEYTFRLVPTRIIIQEARIAEDGAEKCRKVVRKVKKELQSSTRTL